MSTSSPQASPLGPRVRGSQSSWSSLRASSQTSMKSFTLKPTAAQEPSFLKTSRSAWTPKLDPKNNHKLFLERVSLITNWHDKWNERQRRQLLLHLLQRTTEDEILSIRKWIMKRIPEPVWKVDPTSVLPKSIFLHILSFLNTKQLSKCAEVSTHWRYLSEQDMLWRPRAAERAWYLPYCPPPSQHGAWKQYYIMCVSNARHNSQLSAQWEPHQEDEDGKTAADPTLADLRRLGKFHVDTDEPIPEPLPVSRTTEKPGTEEEPVDASLLKERWVDPVRFPKDLDNWNKVANQEYTPDIKHLRAAKRSLKKSYTKLDKVSSTPAHDDTVADHPAGPSSSSKYKNTTITELYTAQGPFRILAQDQDDNVVGAGRVLVTKKGLVVPSNNYWLQKPNKQTLNTDTVHTGVPAAVAVGCGAVWGENMPGHAHPRVLLLSSDVPAYELVVAAVIPGVIGIVYDAEKTSLRSFLNQIEHSLNGRKAQSIGIFAPGKLGCLQLTQHINVTGEDLQPGFWNQLVQMLLAPKLGGRVDIFSSVGVSTVNQDQGLDMIYRLTGLTSVPFNAPLAGIYGEWAEICGTWLLHPDHVHPLSLYLRQDQIRSWALFCEQLDIITREMRQRFSAKLRVQHSAALHRLIAAVVRQGLEVLPGTELTQLADVLFYCLSVLQSEHTTAEHITKTHESEQVKRGVMCMKIVDTLLSSPFVKDLEELKESEEDEKEEKEDQDLAEQGKDILLLLEFMKKSVPYSLQNDTHRFIFPKGIAVDQRMAIVKELVRRESTFLQSMFLIESKLYTPLHEAALKNEKPILASAHLKTCFSDLIQINQVHQVFLARLHQKETTWTGDTTVGDVFLQLSQRFDVYSNYLDNYPSSIAIYRKNINQNPAFWAFIQRFDSQNPTRRKFFSLLTQPMNHMEDLHTLLGSLIFYTPTQHPDRRLLDQALSEFAQLWEVIERARTQYASIGALKTLEQEIIDCPMLTDTGRGVLSHLTVYRVKCTIDPSTGTPQTLSADREFPYLQKYRIYLLQDCILITRIVFQVEPFCGEAQERARFVSTAALSAVRLRNTNHELRFVLYTPQGIHLFECETADAMKNWTDVVNRALVDAPKLPIPNIYVKQSPINVKSVG